MSAREEKPAFNRVPKGQMTSAGGDGQCINASQRQDAIPTNARKGKRQARRSSLPVTLLPTATSSLAIDPTPQGRKHVASGSGGNVAPPIPRKRARRAVHLSAFISALPDATHTGHLPYDTRYEAAGTGGDHHVSDTHCMNVSPALIAGIQSLHREHRAIQRQVGDMERRIKADGRWFAVRRLRAAGTPLPFGKFPPVTAEDQLQVIVTRPRFFAIRDYSENYRKECFGELMQLAKQLPQAVQDMATATKGLALPSVAAIVGEAGDIGSYATVSRLWKRMGLAVIDGKAQGKRKDKKEADKHGYSPGRRSEMHVIGDCLLRAGGAYADLYRTRKEHELTKENITKGHAHKRALRYIEKRLLRELWQTWRGAGVLPEPITALPLADPLAGHFRSVTRKTLASQDGAITGALASIEPPRPPIRRKAVRRASMTTPA